MSGGESRGGHFRDDYPDKDSGFRKGQHRGPQRARWPHGLSRAAIPEMPNELKAVIDEMK